MDRTERFDLHAPLPRGDQLAASPHRNDEVETILARCEQKAREQWHAVFPRPAIHWDLKGRAAGQCRGHTLIRLNAAIASRHPESLAATVAHEYGHAVVNWLHRQSRSRRRNHDDWRPHGRIWQEVMESFGFPPERCHNHPVAPSRQIGTWPYTCGCGTHRISEIRHRRILRGRTVYRCRSCGEPLRPLDCPQQ